jgi:hypothetical protein
MSNWLTLLLCITTGVLGWLIARVAGLRVATKGSTYASNKYVNVFDPLLLAFSAISFIFSFTFAFKMAKEANWPMTWQEYQVSMVSPFVTIAGFGAAVLVLWFYSKKRPPFSEDNPPENSQEPTH